MAHGRAGFHHLRVVVLGTYFYLYLPWWTLAALGAWIIAWQLNLQHETIHGHPTRSRRVNEAIGSWPLSLWLPYSIYRSTHLRPIATRI